METTSRRAEGPLVVCGIAGSLRRGSYDRALLKSAIQTCDDVGRLTDAKTREAVGEFLRELAEWIRRPTQDPASS